MFHHRAHFTSAALSALAFSSLPSYAQNTEQALPPITVTASPFGYSDELQILAPAKVLAGTELRERIGTSLGETLSHQLGVSASGFGTTASRPIIRGLEGPRVKILQNGMAVSDLSALSNDHAVAADTATARQIEILRGPASLLYGSGAIGGLVNIVNDRIPVELVDRPTGEAELRLGSVDREKSLSFSADSAVGNLGLHVDGSARNTSDYRIPGFATTDDPSSSYGKLPSSFSRARSLGFGMSRIEEWGHVGASVDTLDERYGIPTEEQAFIELSQKRLDLDGLFKQQNSLAESLRFKLGFTDYRHTEKETDGTPASNFLNRSLETRWELAHRPLAGWRGTIGAQTEHGKFSALAADSGRPDTVPVTKSSSLAVFVVEERDIGPVRANAGLRMETIRRNPDDATLRERSFTLASYSVGGLWTFTPGYGLGVTTSFAERAPTTEELYSNGPHESTATFDIGDVAMRKEASRNIELSLQKVQGALRWKANLFENRFSNFIYGRTDGTTVDEDGLADPAGEFTRRFWVQDKAAIRGAEVEVSYNWRGHGPSARAFADTSRGRLDNGENLPLQPVTRVGVEAGYRKGQWQANLAAVRSSAQRRLAASESAAAPSYVRVDAGVSLLQRAAGVQWTWFAMVKNLLDEDIRLSTSIIKDVAPQPGRSVILGVRARF
jgi:iron complex outermembrane receptor protein